jgi:hypothetical protein
MGRRVIIKSGLKGIVYGKADWTYLHNNESACSIRSEELLDKSSEYQLPSNIFHELHLISVNST